MDKIQYLPLLCCAGVIRKLSHKLLLWWITPAGSNAFPLSLTNAQFLAVLLLLGKSVAKRLHERERSMV